MDTYLIILLTIYVISMIGCTISCVVHHYRSWSTRGWFAFSWLDPITIVCPLLNTFVLLMICADEM